MTGACQHDPVPGEPTDREVLERLVELWLAGTAEQRRAVFAAFAPLWHAMTRADLHLNVTAGALTDDQERAIEQGVQRMLADRNQPAEPDSPRETP